jgi:PAS domain S-box-containing protein
MAELGQTALSVRERQLLKLAAGGLTDSAIAVRLKISEATVSTYWRRIRTKLGPYSRTELVATLLRNECERVVSALVEENRKLLDRLAADDRRGDALYRRLLEEAADAILVCSHDGVIRMINESAAHLFGWSQHELRGQHISVLVPERYRNHHAVSVERYVSTPSKRKMGDHLATPGLCRDGREIPIAANLSAIGVGSDQSIICIVRQVEDPFCP